MPTAVVPKSVVFGVPGKMRHVPREKDSRVSYDGATLLSFSTTVSGHTKIY